MVATLTRPETKSSLDSFDPADISLNDLEAELARLAAVNDELLAGFRAEASLTATPENLEPGQWSRESTPEDQQVSTPIDVLAENAILRDRVAELESALRDLQDQHWKMSTPASISLHGDLEEFRRLQQDLENERQQFQNERQDWQNQMGIIEQNMAKERAELARLRTDLQRQQAEIDRALENTGWDPQLKQKLVSIPRRPESKVSPSPAKKTSSGIFRRLFGGGQ